MIVHISSGNATREVCRALWHFIQWIKGRYSFEVLALEESSPPRSYRSIRLRSDDSRLLALRGTLLWKSPSPFRPKHKRKNWYFSLEIYEEHQNHTIDPTQVIYQTMKSPKKGGQHVNTTCSGVRAIYLPLGLEAISYDERSQHQNKKIALERIHNKANLLKDKTISQNEQTQWRENKEIKRGDPVMVFLGSRFEH